MESTNVIQLRIAFSAFDEDQDGVLTTGEFADAMSRVSPNEIDEAAMARLVQKLDANGDGLILIDEWLRFCVDEAQR